jgi:hypothetical protein
MAAVRRQSNNENTESVDRGAGPQTVIQFNITLLFVKQVYLLLRYGYMCQHIKKPSTDHPCEKMQMAQNSIYNRVSISNQPDVTLLSFLFWQLYMFRAFFAHLQDLMYCMDSRWL